MMKTRRGIGTDDERRELNAALRNRGSRRASGAFVRPRTSSASSAADGERAGRRVGSVRWHDCGASLSLNAHRVPPLVIRAGASGTPQNFAGVYRHRPRHWDRASRRTDREQSEPGGRDRKRIGCGHPDEFRGY